MSYNIYVGTYLKAETKLVEMFQKLITCSNLGCDCHGLYNSSKFCSKCGSQIKEMNIPQKQPEVSRWELQDNIHENMCCVLTESTPEEPNTIYNYWTSNTTEFDIKINRKTNLEDDEKATEITENMIHSELKTFRDFHKEDIEKINNSGYDRVELHWGVIVYYT